MSVPGAPAIQLRPAGTLAPRDLHAAFQAAFADYLIGPFTLALDAWSAFLGRQGVDLAHSVVALRDGQVLAFALAAPRPELGLWRLATMGAVPAARGSGVAAALLDDFLQRAASAGAYTQELECFAQNERALRLYRSRGFQEIHPLIGYLREPSPAHAGQVTAAGQGDVREVAVADAWAWLDACGPALGDLPLQVTAPSLRAQAVALRAWQCGAGQLVFGATGDAAITVFSLVDPGAAQQDAQALAARLLRDFPGHRVTVPQLQRPDLGGDALERLGFTRQPLHQLLMRRATVAAEQPNKDGLTR